MHLLPQTGDKLHIDHFLVSLVGLTRYRLFLHSDMVVIIIECHTPTWYNGIFEMADNGRMQHMKEVLRKCNISVLTESEFSKTYTNIRREHHQGRPNYSGYKTGLSQELNHSKQKQKSLKLEESIENEPLGLSKKRMYLNELKQSIAAFKQSNSVLQSDSHVLALYLKKSEMLQNDCDARLGANILEMEVPICKLIIRLLRSYEALAQEGDCLKAEKEQLALALKSTESKLQISE